MSGNFYELIQAIEQYYGKGDPRTISVISGQTTVPEFYRIIKDVPGVTIIYNQNGSVRGWEYQNPKLEVETPNSSISEVNSNVSSSTSVSVKTPINTSTSTDTQTGWEVVDLAQGAKAGSAAGATIGGLVKLKKYIPAAVLLATTATKVGLQLNPEYWTTHTTDPILTNLKDVDPETYKEITVTNKEIAEKYPGQDLFDGMLRTFTDPQTGKKKGEVYVEQMAMAYMIESMMQAGAFDRDGEHVEGSVLGQDIIQPLLVSKNSFIINYKRPFAGSFNEVIEEFIIESGNCLFALINTQSQNGYLVIAASTEPYTYRKKIYDNGSLIRDNIISGTNTTFYGYNFYYSDYILWRGTEAKQYYETSTVNISAIQTNLINFTGEYYESYALAMLYGTLIEDGGVEGIGSQPGATVPTFTQGMSLSDIINLLDQTFPDMANKKIVQQVVQPDGTVKEYTYVPTPMPNPNPNPTTGTDPWEKPVTGDSTQDETEIVADPDEDPDPDTDPSTSPNPIVRYVVDDLTEPPEPTQENTGSGSTPPIVLPTGSASALYSVYNPTEGQIHSLGSWLWSSAFVDQLLKMFADPMQAIISLHKIYGTPVTGGSVDIKVGYLNSGVQALSVTDQYVTIDCGTVQLSEYYQSVFDYPPYTDVSIYLPFIGIVRLDDNDVMRSSINVKYHIDVLTGACLCEVNVLRDSAGGILYQYSGDCSVHYPLSSGSYMGVVSSLLGIAGTIASGGALAPMAMGVSAGIMSARTSIERSGSLSGNAGAMGSKKPYLIIQRPQINTPVGFETYTGKPSNEIVKISQCTGFIKCTDVHSIGCSATDSEMSELLSLLQSGIII